MKRFRRFLFLPSSQRILLLQSAFLFFAVLFGLRVLPLALLRRWVCRLAKGCMAWHQAVSADRLIWAVTTVGRSLPGAGNCLPQALVAEALFHAQGLPIQFKIGVAKNRWGIFEAHAWVESGGQVMTGDSDVSHYNVLPLISR